MNSYEDLTYEVKDRIGVITMNRPDKLNALSDAMCDGFHRAMEHAQTSDEVLVVVVTGAGRGFCAGADLSGRVMSDKIEKDDLPDTIAHRRHNLRRVHRVAKAVMQFDKPYIAAVNGPAAGAGMDMASMADIRFAAAEAKFTQAFTRNGIIAGDGGAYFLPRIVGMAKALELLWTSRTFTADEALSMGYVSRVVPGESLMEETLTFARELAAGPPVAIQFMKQLAYKSQDVEFDTALMMAQWTQTIASATEDAKEGASAQRERRPANFKGR